MKLLNPFNQSSNSAKSILKLIKSVPSLHKSLKSNYMNFSGNYSNQLNKFNLKQFGGKNDKDYDGVLNKFDCNPLSVMRQDFSPFRYGDNATKLSAAKRFGGQNNLNNLKKIGSGRDRTVYALDKDKVIKIAKNPGGLTQNTSESDLEYLEMGKHYETGLDYTVMRRNNPLSQKNKIHLRNIRKDINTVPQSYGGFNNDANNRIAIRTHLSEDDSSLDKANINKDILNYDFNSQELFANRQWGEDADGVLALNDGGALQDETSIKRYRVKDFQQVANIDRNKAPPWQLEEWQQTQNQRQQFRNKGNIKKHYPKSVPYGTPVGDAPTGDVTSYNAVSDFFNSDDQLHGNLSHGYQPDASIMTDFSMNPTDESGKGRCGDAAKCIATDAFNKGIPESDIEIIGVKAPNLKKPSKIYSNHMVAKIGDTYYDPTKTQFGYDDPELESKELDSRYNTITPQPLQQFIKKPVSEDINNE